MIDFTSRLRQALVIIFEMEGMAGVETYARDNRIPLNVCRKLVAAYQADLSAQQKPNRGPGS